LTPTEETELFISLATEELTIYSAPFYSLDILITEAFSPFFLLTKPDSPDLTLEIIEPSL
jgi:hypothetical protein